MKIERISEHVWSLRTWLIIPITVWIVVEEDGLTLVDAGMPPMAKGIMNFVRELGGGPLRRILLTHGHLDHVGAVRRILAAHPVTVHAHSLEIPHIEGELPYPRRKKAAAVLPKGLTRPLPSAEEGILHPVGRLTPYHTPGHSPGHTVFHHAEDNVLLAGDLLTSRKGRIGKPMRMWTADMKQALESAAIVRSLRPERLEICHGGPVFHPSEQFDAFLNRTGFSRRDHP